MRKRKSLFRLIANSVVLFAIISTVLLFHKGSIVVNADSSSYEPSIIVTQPSEDNNYTVELIDNPNNTYQWYKFIKEEYSEFFDFSYDWKQYDYATFTQSTTPSVGEVYFNLVTTTSLIVPPSITTTEGGETKELTFIFNVNDRIRQVYFLCPYEIEIVSYDEDAIDFDFEEKYGDYYYRFNFDDNVIKLNLTYKAEFEVFNNSIPMNGLAFISQKLEKLEGETSATLSTGTNGDKYLCKVSDGTNTNFTDTVEYVVENKGNNDGGGNNQSEVNPPKQDDNNTPSERDTNNESFRCHLTFWVILVFILTAAAYICSFYFLKDDKKMFDFEDNDNDFILVKWFKNLSVMKFTQFAICALSFILWLIFVISPHCVVCTIFLILHFLGLIAMVILSFFKDYASNIINKIVKVIKK